MTEAHDPPHVVPPPERMGPDMDEGSLDIVGLKDPVDASRSRASRS